MCLEKVIRDPLMIGFISFTRAARREASSRAASMFSIPVNELEKDGWYRTLHSVCYRQLKVGPDELITGTREDAEWLAGALGAPVRLTQARHDDDYLYLYGQGGDAEVALALWDVARNRLCSLEDVWRKAVRLNDRVPDLGACLGVIADYERAKEKHGRLDFTDLLLRYAGYKWTGDWKVPLTACEPRGAVFSLPVWLHDEAQDASALAAAVFRRLTAHAQYVYIMGDDWQTIYQWAGSDGSIFADWPVAKEEVLPVSYRCRSNILAKAQSVMHRGGHKPREFRAMHQGGEVVHAHWEHALESVVVGEDTLVLGRTNAQARAAAQFLESRLVPWKANKGGDGADAPARAAGVTALVRLQGGGEVDGDGIRRLLELLPSRTADGTELFARGTKAWFADRANREALLPVRLAQFDCVGATEAAKALIGSGKYIDLLEPAPARMVRCAQKHGTAAVGDPKCRIGTLHSSKGQEADHVVLVNDLPGPTLRAMETAEGMDEERRCWYVGCSRARHRLTITEGGIRPFADL